MAITNGFPSAHGGDESFRSKSQGFIRESEYGDREDVTAEQEELSHELGAFDLPEPRYPPLTNLKAPRWTQRLRILSTSFRRHKVKLRLIISFSVIWPLLFWAIVYLFFSSHSVLFPNSLRKARSTLFVVAHPDDECLFFAPTVLASVRRARAHGALLVLSSGNHYGLGSLRKNELKKSCETLGIREERCDVIDVSDLQDDPTKWWPAHVISKIVEQHIQKWLIDSLVTFDSGGISGHVNHRAVSAAVTQLALAMNTTYVGTIQSSPPPSLFVVKTVNSFRKYTGLYDLPFSLLSLLPSLIFGPSSQHLLDLNPVYNAATEHSALESERRRKKATLTAERGLLLSGWSDYLIARSAFWSHGSQLVWDRHIYMVLSQYMYFNVIERVV